MNESVPGATVNVGVISGGSFANVVPAAAQARIDVRAYAHAALDQITAALETCAARTIVPDTTATLTGGVWRPPMERMPATDQLVALCQRAAQAAGISVGAATTGGTSDANFTVALGVPSLDGLGPIGGLDHGPDEYILVSSIVPRTVMLAGLIEAIAAQPQTRFCDAWRVNRFASLCWCGIIPTGRQPHGGGQFL